LPLYLRPLPWVALLATWIAPLCPAHAQTEFRPGRGVHFASDDQQFSLDLWLRNQLRYTLDNEAAPGDRDLQHTIELRRASVFMAGHAYGEHNKYFVQLIFSPRELGIGSSSIHSPLFDWFFTFDHLRDLSVHAGQFKPYYSRQFIAPWGGLQFVDRSIVEKEFLANRDIGIDIYSRDLFGAGMLRYDLGLFANRGRDSFRRGPLYPSLMARVEIMPLGFFEALQEGDLGRSRQPGVAVGVAYKRDFRAPRDRGVVGDPPDDGGTTDFHNLTADAVFKIAGLSAQAAVFYRDGDRRAGNALDATTGMRLPTSQPRDAVGGFVQVGQLFPGLPLEVAARVGRTAFRDAVGLPDRGELGGAVSYYLSDHNFKLQADYFHLWNDGELGDGADQLRVQLQSTL
jgi:hypothetical protein